MEVGSIDYDLCTSGVLKKARTFWFSTLRITNKFSYRPIQYNAIRYNTINILIIKLGESTTILKLNTEWLNGVPYLHVAKLDVVIFFHIAFNIHLSKTQH